MANEIKSVAWRLPKEESSGIWFNRGGWLICPVEILIVIFEQYTDSNENERITHS
jgi:hypothetical protein